MSKFKPFERVGGYTVFENEILDYIMRQCKPNTWKVICTTIRKTTGWHKEKDMISLSQYMEHTGIKNRTTLLDAIKDAINLQYLLRYPKGNSYVYSLNRDLEIDSTEIVPVRKSTQEESENRTEESLESVHTKDSKERNKKARETEEPKNPNPFSPKDPSPPREQRTAESNKASTLEAMQRGIERHAKGDPDFGWLSESLWPYAKTFIHTAGEIYIPIEKSEHSLWRKELAYWQKAGFTLDIIRTAINKMRQDDLTINGPQSIRAICKNLIATKNKGGNQGTGTTPAELEADGYERM